jgi:hypothetical protein
MKSNNMANTILNKLKNIKEKTNIIPGATKRQSNGKTDCGFPKQKGIEIFLIVIFF